MRLPPATVQLADPSPRPRRESVNYDKSYTGPSQSESYSAFVELAKSNIAQLHNKVTVQGYRNTAAAAIRSETTRAYLCARMNDYCVGAGASGASTHAEVAALDNANWSEENPGNQYYLVCDEGKPCCYLCSAIAALLKLAIADKDASTYSDYVSPKCLQESDTLWQNFVGAEAYALWKAFPLAKQQRFRENLGWVHNLGSYWTA